MHPLSWVEGMFFLALVERTLTTMLSCTLGLVVLSVCTVCAGALFYLLRSRWFERL